jgi:hypothetical protein
MKIFIKQPLHLANRNAGEVRQRRSIERLLPLLFHGGDDLQQPRIGGAIARRKE